MRFAVFAWIVLIVLTACGKGAEERGATVRVERVSLPVGAEMRRDGAGLRLLSGREVVIVEGGRLRAVVPGEARLVTDEGAVVEVVVPPPDRLELALEPELEEGGVWWLGESRRVRLWAVTGEEAHDVAPWAQWSLSGGLSRNGEVITAGEVGPAAIKARWQGEVIESALEIRPAPDPVVSWTLEGEARAWAAGEARRFTLWAIHESGKRSVPEVVDGTRLQLSPTLEGLGWQGGELRLRAVATGPAEVRWDGETIATWEIAPPYWVSLELARADGGPEPAAVGEQVCLEVSGVDSLGERGSPQALVWEIDGTLLEAVGGGCFRVKGEGQTVVTVRAGDVSASLMLELRRPRLVALELGLDDPAILPGERLALRVVERYSDDTTAAPASLSWEIEDASVVAINEEGPAAVAPGSTRIRASNGVLWSDWLTVEVAEGVVIEPESLSLAAGSEGRLDAYARYPDRQVQLTDEVQWRSANEEVVTVDTGVVFGVSPGTVTVETIPAAQQPASVEVTPRGELWGAGPHRLETGDFYSDRRGNQVAAVTLRGLTPATLVTPRLAQVPLGSSLLVSRRTGEVDACFNQALATGLLGCSLATDAAGELVITVVIPESQFSSAVDLTVQTGGFVDEGVGPDGPLPLTLGVPHEGTVVNGGQSHYRIALSGEGRYRLLAELLEGGGATMVMYGISSAEGDCQGNLSLPQDCTFLPENVGNTQVDLLVFQWAASPEGGTRYRLTVERLVP